MKPPTRLRSIVAAAEARGWTYDLSGNDHPRLSPPPGWVDPATGRLAMPVTFACTPSDVRGDLNSMSYLRRLGVALPRKNHKKKADR